MRQAIATAVLAALIMFAPQASAERSKRPTDSSTDEAGMWYAVDKIEESLQNSGLRLTDPALVDYARKVTCNVTGDDCNQIRIYIIDAPYFNAGMYPNGMMLLNSGLLLRAENEAQLACVIGHEYGHFKEDHSLKRWRTAKTVANLSILANFAGAAAGAGREASLGSSIASLLYQQSYSREHEREADLIGFEVAAKAGYKAEECAKVWSNVIGESTASEFRRVRKGATSRSPFSSHPVPTERQATLAELAARSEDGQTIGKDTHDAVTRPFLHRWLDTELLAQDYDRHLHLFEELKTRGREAGVLDFYRGEAYRLRRDDGDSARAFEAWEQASADPMAPAAVWRALGEHYRRAKEDQKAIEAYETYLRKAPNAEDKALIAAYAARLKTKLGQ